MAKSVIAERILKLIGKDYQDSQKVFANIAVGISKEYLIKFAQIADEKKTIIM